MISVRTRAAALVASLLLAAGCGELPADPPPEVEAPPDGLEGTVWVGTFDHQNAQGCRTGITWYFRPGGVLRQVRHDGQEVLGTWTARGDEVVADMPAHGAIDLKRTGDALSGGARFRGGYGFGWEYELRLRK